MKAIFTISILAAVIASTAATAAAFVQIDKGMKSINRTAQAEESTAVIYGHRIGPAGQEMLITRR